MGPRGSMWPRWAAKMSHRESSNDFIGQSLEGEFSPKFGVASGVASGYGRVRATKVYARQQSIVRKYGAIGRSSAVQVALEVRNAVQDAANFISRKLRGVLKLL
jgi:hypothetical protein